MNGDHPEDNLLIARAFGNPEASSATMIGLDESAGQWTYTVSGTSADPESHQTDELIIPNDTVSAIVARHSGGTS